MKLRITALVLALLLLTTATAAAQTTQDREARYVSTIQELENFFYSGNENSDDLRLILDNFDDLGNFRQSRFMCYYVNALINIIEGSYDYEYGFNFDQMELNTLFCEYLEEQRKSASPIGTVAELKSYGEGRKCELYGDREGAANAYKNCLAFYDAAYRRGMLMKEASDTKYREAVALLKKNDLAGAYMAFSAIREYSDSADRMNYIERMLGYTPASETDNPAPVTGLKVSNITVNGMTVSWDQSVHAKSYRVEYKETSGSGLYKVSTDSTTISINQLSPDTFYSISVIAIVGQMETDKTTVSSKTAPLPDPVSGLKATEVKPTSVELAWNNVSGATYKVSWKKHSSDNWTDWHSTSNAKFSIISLESSTDYDFKVVAIANGGTSAERVLSGIRTANPKPDAVTGLKVSDVETTTMKLSWNPVNGASSYRVCFKKSDSSTWSEWYTVDHNSCSFSTLESAAAYDIKVVAVANGITSDEATITNVKTAAPPAVSGLKTSDVSSTSVSLTWNPVSEASSYQVSWRKHDAGSWAKWKDTNHTSFSVSELESGGYYDFKVVAVSNSTASADKILTNIRTAAPSAVTGLKVSSADTTSISLTWDIASDASSYKVSWKKHAASSWDNPESTTSAGFNITGLESGMAYDIKVISVSNGTSSPETTLSDVKTMPSAVTGLSASAVSSSSIEVSWNKVSNATSYKICWKTSSSGNWSDWQPTTDKKYTVTDLESNTAYDFKVIAVANNLSSPEKTITNIKTKSATPSAVTGLKAKSTGTSYVELIWNSSANASEYLVYYKRNSSSGWTEYGSTGSTTCKIINLYSDAQYDFKIVAEGNGLKSSETVLNNIRTNVTQFKDGRLKDTSITVTIKPRYREKKNDKNTTYKSAKSLSAGEMKQNIKKQIYPGIYYRIDLPKLATKRVFTIRIDLEAPNKYQDTILLEEDCELSNEGKWAWYWYCLGVEYFKSINKSYGGIPTGTYKLTLYMNEMLVNTTTFTVSK